MLLHRLGRATARHPWRTIATWLLILVALGGLSSALGGELTENWNVPGTRAQAGIDQLRAHFPDAGGSSAQVLLHDDTTIAPTVVEDVVDRPSGAAHVVDVHPRFSDDGDTALLYVRYDVPTTDPDLIGEIGPLEAAGEPATQAGYQVAFGGELPSSAGTIGGSAELIGILVALGILVFAFGSVVAAGLPIATAVAGLVAGSSGVLLLAGVTNVSPDAPTVATMVGLGVGIDYALLITTRHVSGLRSGLGPVDAAACAMATAGRSVAKAGVTVLVSLLGLRLAGLPTFDAFGLATAIAVLCVMAAALTLVPALCALAGRRLMPRRERRGTPATPGKEPLSARWARRVGRRPVAWATLALVVLLSLGAPALGMHTWPQDGGSDPKGSTTRTAYDLISDEFGPGANGPIAVVADLDRVDGAEVAGLHARIAELPGIATSTSPVTSPDGALAVWEIEPSTPPADQRTTDLLDHLRDSVFPDGVEATGHTPILGDISDMLADRLWLVVGFVVAVSVVWLTVMFRSVIVPLKAAAMNLLSISAAYGVLVLVFQHGYGLGLLGLDHAIPVSSWVPILMFAVLFGLSMDYEVFLLSAIREDWLDTGDARGSLVRGLAASSRVITVAAAIMVVVFLGFAAEQAVVVKMIGLGLAVAVALDATVVRLVLVPATMTLLGRWNWWFPRLGRAPTAPPQGAETPSTAPLTHADAAEARRTVTTLEGDLR